MRENEMSILHTIKWIISWKIIAMYKPMTKYKLSKKESCDESSNDEE